MQKTKIEWCDYTINPVKGLCPMHCKTLDGYEYCYAAGTRGLYKRFKWNPEIRFDVNSFLPLLITIRRKPSRIFVGSTIELFGDWVKLEWMRFIFDRVQMLPEHTFIFLTKCPQKLSLWSPFPPNVYIGVSITNQEQYDKAILYLKDIDATVKFLSIEPLLEHIEMSKLSIAGISWLICGAQTPYNPKTAPKMSWVQDILVAASNAGNIPVFMKDNLQPVIDHDSLWAGWKLRQEFPVVEAVL